MENLSILNRKEVKNILNIINQQWEIDVKLDYVFLKNPKDKVYIANKEIFSLDFKKLRINSVGMYFGQFKDDKFRLSIEGAQLIGTKAKKNVVELDDDEARQWLKGIDLDKDMENDKKQGFVIIRHKNDILGCGKAQDNKIWNYVSKARRIRCSD